MNATIEEPEVAYLCPHCKQELPDPEGDYADYVTWCEGDGRDYHEDCFEEIGFTCGVCDEHFLNADLHHLAVVEPQSGVKRGVYRIISFPFYANGLIGGQMFRWALRRDGHLTGDEPDEYPVCLLCPGCAAERGVKKEANRG